MRRLWVVLRPLFEVTFTEMTTDPDLVPGIKSSQAPRFRILTLIVRE